MGLFRCVFDLQLLTARAGVSGGVGGGALLADLEAQTHTFHTHAHTHLHKAFLSWENFLFLFFFNISLLRSIFFSSLFHCFVFVSVS